MICVRILSEERKDRIQNMYTKMVGEEKANFILPFKNPFRETREK